MHFGRFSIRSRSWQESAIVLRVSVANDEMIRSSAITLTLCGLEQLVEEDPVISFVGQNHLSVSHAGCHFSSMISLISSVKFSL